MHRVADQHRHDVADRGHDRQTNLDEAALQGLGALLMADAHLVVLGEPAHAGQGPCGQGRRQRGGEDETRGIGADGVDQHGVAGDIAAHDPERLAQRAFDDVDLVQNPVALGDAAAAQAVEADRVHLVEIGQRIVLLGQGHGAGQVGDVAVHGIDALEGNQLRRIDRRIDQHRFQMLQVVVAEDVPLGAAIADAGDHRGVVQRVGIDDQARQHLGQGRQRRLIGHEARGQQQRGFLAVQLGEFGLQFDVIMGGAGDVARAAGAGAGLVDGLVHGVGDDGVLPLADIVVGAPDHDVALAAVIPGPGRARKVAAIAFQVGENPIASLALDLLDGGLECGLVVHQSNTLDVQPFRPLTGGRFAPDRLICPPPENTVGDVSRLSAPTGGTY